MSVLTQALPSFFRRIVRRPTNTSSWTMGGHGYRKEWWLIRGFVSLYFRHTRQEWSPNLTEHERERGITLGHRRFVMVETVCQFKDGKEPRTKRGHF